MSGISYTYSEKVLKLPKSTDRNSNIELLRILLMILLIASHYVHNSGLLDVIYSSPIGLKSYIILIFGMWGKPAINCFVLITGYFMCDKEIKYSKIIKLICQVLFYNIIIYFIFVLLGEQTFSITGFLKCLNPIPSISQNFVSCYIVFFFFIPFLNILIKNMSRKKHFIILTILLTMFTVLGSIPRYEIEWNYVAWFATLYLLASYFKQYMDKVLHNKRLWIIAFVVSYLLVITSIIVGLKVSFEYNMRLAYYFIEDSNKIGALLLSVSLFFLMNNINIKKSRLINCIAAVTFDVLLIHANSDAMRTWIWNKTVNCINQYNGSNYLILAFISVIAIYVICVSIGLIRLYLIERPIIKHLKKHFFGGKKA